MLHSIRLTALLVIVLQVGTVGCGTFAAQGKNAQGVRYFQQARYQEALNLFQQALDDDPNNADAYYNLASVYHRMATSSKRQADFDQAESYYNRCLDFNDNHTDCFRGLAVLLAEQGYNDKAYRLLEGWSDRHPQSAEARVELARLCEENGDLARAKSYITDALALAPENARALTALGHLQERTGEVDQALASYQRSLWHDRFQPEVAARVASLRPGIGGTGGVPTVPGTDGATEMVSRGTGTIR